MTLVDRDSSQPTRRSLWVVLALALAFAGLVGWMGLARFAAVHNRTFDLALYARLAWGVVNGQPWDPIAGGHLFSGHMPLVLVPLAVLGEYFGFVPVLLTAQALALGLAALPLSSFAARRLGPVGGLVAAFAWLLYPNLGHVGSYEFHPGTLAVLPLCLALDALDRGRPRALLVLSLCVVLCRASLSLQTALLGVLALRAGGTLRRAGLGLTLGSLAYFALPFAFGLLSPGSAGESSSQLHFGKWGGSPLGALASPALLLSHLFEARRLTYPLLVLLPLALLPLVRPRFLLVALPPLALNLLSEFPTSVELYSHYLTPAVPALAFAAVEGLSALAKDPRRRLLGQGALCACAIATSFYAGALPGCRQFRVDDYRFTEDSAAARTVLARIGRRAAIQAPDPLLPHLAERRRVHRAPPPERKTRYVVLDASHRRRFAHSEDLLRTVEEPLVRQWLARPDYAVTFATGDLIVLRRGRPPRAGLFKSYFAGLVPAGLGQSLTECLGVRGAKLGKKQLWLELVARGPCPKDLALRLGAEALPTRVDLPFDGLVSPALLQPGDLMRSPHVLSATERAAIAKHGLHIGALRSSGARPKPGDPQSIAVAVQ